MQIREMFAKPIDRDLQGVIIVGQDETANVKQELEEYVVTRELQKHLQKEKHLFRLLPAEIRHWKSQSSLYTQWKRQGQT